jgi:predicted TIM-barrel fold metal-dependent hydrolase
MCRAGTSLAHSLAGHSCGRELGSAPAAHVLRLIYGRAFDRHPRATVILGHMGEFLPFQLARLARLARLDARHGLNPRRGPAAPGLRAYPANH